MVILRFIFIGLLLFFLKSNCSAQSWKESTGAKWNYDLSKVRILTIVFDGFNYEEAIEISDYWKNWGAAVVLAGTKPEQQGEKSNPASDQPHDVVPATLKTDMLIKDVDYKKFDLIYIAGGEGVADFLNDNREQLKRIIDGAVQNQKFVAAICHGPAALAAAETLRGHTVTVQGNEFRAELQKAGAKVVNELFVGDGSFLTGQWPYFETFAVSVAEKVAYPEGNGPYELAEKALNPVLRNFQNIRNTWIMRPGNISNDTLELIIKSSVNPMLPVEMMNNSSIRFVAVRDNTLKSDLIDQIIQVSLEKYKEENLPVESVKKLWLQIFNAPVILFVFNDLSGLESLKSASEKEMFTKIRTLLAGESSSQLALVAKEFGYGVSMLGGQRTMVAEEGFKKVLAVPPSYQLVNIIGIGHPLQQNNPPVKRPVSEYLLIK